MMSRQLEREYNLMYDACNGNYSLLLNKLDKKYIPQLEALMKQCYDLGEFVGITKRSINENIESTT